MTTTPNKEQIHDEQISPLVQQIITICQQNGIAMVASFSIPTSEGGSLNCTTCIPGANGNGPQHKEAADLLFGSGNLSPTMRNVAQHIKESVGAAQLMLAGALLTSGAAAKPYKAPMFILVTMFQAMREQLPAEQQPLFQRLCGITDTMIELMAADFAAAGVTG